MFFYSIMYLKVFLQVTLLGKLHIAALHLAHEGFILGVAPEMGEILAQRRNHALAAFEMASKYLELAFRRDPLDIVYRVIARRRNVVLIPVPEQVLLVVVSSGDLGSTPVGTDAVGSEEGLGEKVSAELIF
jgi:hypothetical protein